VHGFAFYSQVARLRRPYRDTCDRNLFYYSALHFIRENRTRSLLWKSTSVGTPSCFSPKTRGVETRENAKAYLRWLETSTCNAKLHRMEIRVLEGPTINSVNDGITACNVTSLPVSRFLLPSFLFLPLSLCLRCDIRQSLYRQCRNRLKENKLHPRLMHRGGRM